MRRTFVRTPAQWLAWMLALIAAVYTDTTFAQSSCDRGCLQQTLDRYLTAVVDNSPETAPLAVGIRQTDNAVNFAVGRGVWSSVTDLGPVQRRFFDPVSGQAGYYGAIVEGGSMSLATIRIRVESREITEAEWVVARPGDPGLAEPRPGRQANLLNVEYLTANPPPDRTVPGNERLDRAALIRIVDSYFDAITSHDRSVALVHRGCGRAENGTPAPGGLFLPQASPDSPAPSSDRDCVTNLENFDLQMVVARRTPLVDVEAQVVLSYGIFIRRPGSERPRNIFSEWFFIDDARIRTIYTAMFYPPADLAVPNWPPYHGNWPLPVSIDPGAGAP